MSTLILFANNATSTLATPITAAATTATLAAGTGALFPNPTSGEYFVLTFLDAATQTIREIVWVTGISGDTITAMTRGQEGTTPTAYLAGDYAQSLITAGILSTLQSVGAAAQPGIAAAAGEILTGPTTLAGAPVPVTVGTALTISGGALDVQLGTTGTTAAAGNDSRIVNAMPNTTAALDALMTTWMASLPTTTSGQTAGAWINSGGVLQQVQP